MSKVLSKETFCDYINKIVVAHKYQEELESILNKYKSDFETAFMTYQGLSVDFEYDLVRLLDDVLDTDMVSFWIYECNYGRDTKERIQEANGTYILIDTPSQLYEYICSEYSN